MNTAESIVTGKLNRVLEKRHPDQRFAGLGAIHQADDTVTLQYLPALVVGADSAQLQLQRLIHLP